MELAAYIHGALAYEQSLEGIDLETSWNCTLADAAIASMSSAKNLLCLTLVASTIVLSTNVIPVFAANGDLCGADLQVLLTEKGFYTGPITGFVGPLTTEAVLKAQQFYGLEQDGVAGAMTIAALTSDTYAPTATNVADASDSGYSSDVDGTHLQQLLTTRGFYTGPITGFIGSLTKDAVVKAQAFYGLEQDGIAGPKTLAALESDTYGTSTPVNVSDSSNSDQVANSSVTDLQILLTNRGFYNGPITGVEGPLTKEAILRAQAFYGLTQDSIAGPKTLAALSSDTGSNGATPPVPITTPSESSITTLQNLLTDRGFYSGPITGVAGPLTSEAILRAQAFYGLPQDGVAGPETLAALENDSFSSSNNDGGNNSNPAPTSSVPTTPPIASPPPSSSAPPSSSGSAPIASNGSVNTMELQSLLMQKGFYTGVADGALGTETKNSIIRAQNFYGITPANGVPSESLAKALRNDPFTPSNG